MTAQTPTPFGDLDGEPIDAVTIKISGTTRFPRSLDDGERVVLVVEGTAKPDVAIKRTEGRLVRGQTIRLDTAAEPTDQLADEATIFLKLIADAENGRTELPFDEDENCICDYDYDEGTHTINTSCPIHGAEEGPEE